MRPKNRIPTSPGEILLEEFLVPRKMTQVELAAKIGVPLQRINSVISGRRAVSPETAILLGRSLGTSAEFWLNLQTARDLWLAEKKLAKTA